MQFRLLYVWKTTIGPFYIGQSEDGRFHPIYEGQSLGSYAHDFQAAEHLAGGHTFSIASRVDISKLGIPGDIREWEPVPRR